MFSITLGRSPLDLGTIRPVRCSVRPTPLRHGVAYIGHEADGTGPDGALRRRQRDDAAVADRPGAARTDDRASGAGSGAGGRQRIIKYRCDNSTPPTPWMGKARATRGVLLAVAQ